MTTFLIIVHVTVSLFLIAVVLLQSGKGADMGAAFGGSSQTLFGSRGAATFLSKMTTISAVAFMLTSFILAIVTTKGSSIVKKVPVTQEQKSVPPAAGTTPGVDTKAVPMPLQQGKPTPQPAAPQAQQQAPQAPTK
ncbi:MAG: preprotein translocase subunit SecG [Nitrospira sp.]|nr:preprotein translocase subunit SecG [Nitrospira sp.]